MRRGALAVMLACSACDAVFLEEHERFFVTGSYLVRRVELDGPTSPREVVGTTPYEVAIEVIDRDGSSRPVTLEADGDFAFDSEPGVPYRLAIRGELDGAPIEYQGTREKLDL